LPGEIGSTGVGDGSIEGLGGLHDETSLHLHPVENSVGMITEHLTPGSGEADIHRLVEVAPPLIVQACEAFDVTHPIALLRAVHFSSTTGGRKTGELTGPGGF
jgi:hypothetical protein